MVYLPALTGVPNKDEFEFVQQLCNKHHFKFWDMRDVYEGENETDLSLTDVDIHPNKKGHQVIANKFYQTILNHQNDLGLTITEKNLPQ